MHATAVQMVEGAPPPLIGGLCVTQSLGEVVIDRRSPKRRGGAPVVVQMKTPVFSRSRPSQMVIGWLTKKLSQISLGSKYAGNVSRLATPWHNSRLRR